MMFIHPNKQFIKYSLIRQAAYIIIAFFHKKIPAMYHISDVLTVQ